ncbi:MAG TPA: peptide deformylase [Candidatus Omnitrophota bacterium]|nr:peptide deformylase [Candidatus Omnitrophota bacterium]
MSTKRVLKLWEKDQVNEEDAAILRKTSDDLVVPFDQTAKAQIKDLMRAFLVRNDALGLAAPQIGINKRIIIFRNKNFDDPDWTKDEKDYEVLVNPRISQARGEQIAGSEGCLSCPDIRVEILRYPEIKVRAYNINGEKISKRYTDFLARIVQHEIDHLEGKLIIDYEGNYFIPKNRQDFFTRLLKE